jgi:transposase-like protein
VGAAEDDAAAYELLERVRWGGVPPACPHCSAGDCYFLRPQDGLTRTTRTGARTARRIWKCRSCRRQFSALTGTVLAGSRVPARTLVAVLLAWAGGGRPAARDAAVGHGLTAEAVQHLLRRIDAAIDAAGRADPLLAVLGSADAEAIRWTTPARRRPRPQAGPSADHGAG